MEFFVKKSGPFLNAGCIMYSIGIFFILHFTYLGCVHTQRTPPPAYGPVFSFGLLTTSLKEMASSIDGVK